MQARIRGNVLMTISNKFGWMVLTTGNKSEMATGYATLYGDMAGGFAVIKDVPKTLVYALCRDLNERAGREVIPQAVIDKPPSAELRPDQKDTDSLPAYDVLDPILEGYVEDDLSVARARRRAASTPTLVRRVARMVDRNEYKRRQAPPGVRVSPQGVRQGPPARRSPTAGPAERRSVSRQRDGETRRPLLPELALIAATIAYGATFMIVQDALEHVTPVGFILLRFAVGTHRARAVRVAARVGGARASTRRPRDVRARPRSRSA